MNAFRTVCVVVFALVLGAAASQAQSLAEVAKKEKERRQKNNDDASTIITDRELSRSYGGLPATAPGASATSEDGAAPADEGADEESGEEQDETQTREYWQTRIQGTKDKIAQLEERLESEDWGEGQRFGVDPRGVQNLSQRQQTEADLAQARQELAQIQDEGRRAGVPPGWLR